MVLGIIVLIVGVILALYGIYLLISFQRLTTRLTAQTTGTLLGFFYGTTRKKLGRPQTTSQDLIHLKVAYDVEGEHYELPERQTLSSAKKYTVGMPLEILYDPRFPEVFRVSGNRADFNSGLILLGVGAAFVALSLLLMSL